MTTRWGSVHLVGAGPGAVDLLTGRGLARLRAADIVVHDRLVSRDLLDEAPPTAERIDVGKASGDRSPGGKAFTQASICALLVAHARLGRVVVRLKGGDPFVFGRGAEELDACLEAGVRCEIVPGLSSALAAPAAAGIAVTERGRARSFAVTTARTAQGVTRHFAAADTQVILMAVEELPSVVASLISDGIRPTTPSALVASATLANQRTVFAPLCRMVAAGRYIEPPAVLVVGETVGRALERRRFRLRADGLKVALTRPLRAAHRTEALLAASGARVISSPLIDVAYRPADEVARALGHELAPWIVFASRHGVEGFWRGVVASGGDARALAGSRLAVIGPGTAEALARRGLRADLVAAPHRAQALVEALGQAVDPAERILFAGGSRARRQIVDGLAHRGLAVAELSVYETVPRAPTDAFRRALEDGVDAVVFASPSAATSFGEHRLATGEATAVCLGPPTVEAVQPLGFRRVATALRHDDHGLVAAVLATASA